MLLSMWRRHHARPRPRLLAALIACIAALAAFALSAGTAVAAAPANDDFANATLVPAALPSTQSGTLEEATAESGEPDHTGTTFFSGRHTVWYRWTPAASATVVIQTCGSAAFSSAAVYTGSSVGGLSSKLGSTTDCGNGTSTTLSAVGGTTYRIGIENNTVGNGAPGAYTLRILQKGTISGTVTAAGAPVGNFCVSAIDPQTGMAGDTATTSGTGAYTLTLLPGDYKVGFAPCTSGGPHARQFYDGAVKIDDASVISLGSGGSRTGVNASLKAASSIAGTVTGEGGFPVPGACVQAFDPDHPSKAVATGSSDFGGQYVISNLAATDYIVRFSTDCGSGGPLKPEFYDDALTFGSADPVTLAVGQARTGIDASLGDGGSISGIIRNDLGDPVEDICVIATAPGIEGAQSTQSAADGTYSLTGLDPGDYTLEFEDCNGLDYVTEYYDNSPVAGGADPVAVAREADVTAVNATLARRGAIEGTVTLPGGGPADSACVTAFDAEGNGVASGSTDASGRYRVEGLQPGNYRIHFFPCIGGNLLGVYYDGKPDLDSANPVVVIAGQTTSSIDAQLASAGSISGTVTAAGQPAVGVCPEALDSSGGVVSGGGTDADGNYTIGGLEAGSYRVVFRDCDGGNLATEFYDDKPTFQSANAVNVTAGANTANVDAQLAAGGSISGTITDGAAPAGDVCVSAYNVADSSVPISNGVSGADGQYTVTGLAAGSYKVHFDGGCAGDLSAEYYDDAASFAAADVVTVTGTADTANINGSLTAGTLPSATISGGPNGATNNPAPTFTFSTTGAGTIQCSLDQGTPSFGSCSGAGSHTPATNLADGAWTFRVRVTNSAGQDTKTRSFSVDTQPPALLISGGPTGPTNLKRPTFSFDAESGSGVQCSIDAGAANFGSCSATSSHQPTTDLGDGSYTFRVRATDAAGNTRTQTRSFTVDTVAPISTISAGPENGSTIGTSTTQFVFSADEANATIYCSIDNGVYGPCTSPKELSGLTDGPHSFKIAAVDAAVNTGPGRFALLHGRHRAAVPDDRRWPERADQQQAAELHLHGRGRFDDHPVFDQHRRGQLRTMLHLGEPSAPDGPRRRLIRLPGEVDRRRGQRDRAEPDLHDRHGRADLDDQRGPRQRLDDRHEHGPVRVQRRRGERDHLLQHRQWRLRPLHLAEGAERPHQRSPLVQDRGRRRGLEHRPGRLAQLHG